MHVGNPIRPLSSRVAILLRKVATEAAIWLAYQQRTYFLNVRLRNTKK